jgi:hypothetical protein
MLAARSMVGVGSSGDHCHPLQVVGEDRQPHQARALPSRRSRMRRRIPKLRLRWLMRPRCRPASCAVAGSLGPLQCQSVLPKVVLCYSQSLSRSSASRLGRWRRCRSRDRRPQCPMRPVTSATHLTARKAAARPVVALLELMVSDKARSSSPTYHSYRLKNRDLWPRPGSRRRGVMAVQGVSFTRRQRVRFRPSLTVM